MRNRLRHLLKNRPGSVLAFVAVALPATLGTMALAIDLGMLHQARVQAQRAADSAALAGASAYLDFTPAPNAVHAAEDRAYEYALTNNIRGTGIDSAEVSVSVLPADYKVYVHVRRQNIPTWFARFLGFNSGDVSADATAQAAQAGAVNCLRPLALPDYWHDANNDANGNRVWDVNEQWEWNPGSDYYAPWQQTLPAGVPEETGYGSDHRDETAPPAVGDAGRQVILKQPNGNSGVAPGWFFPLRLEGNSGANDFENSLKCRCGEPGCNTGHLAVGDSIDEENGAMVGPTSDAVLDVVGQDAGAYWDQNSGSIQGTSAADWRDSPRVWLLALFDPHQIPNLGGNAHVTPNNFAYFFLEGFWQSDGTVCTVKKCNKDPVVGRFLYFGAGVGSPGPQTGSLIRQLRLVD